MTDLRDRSGYTQGKIPRIFSGSQPRRTVSREKNIMLTAIPKNRE